MFSRKKIRYDAIAPNKAKSTPFGLRVKHMLRNVIEAIYHNYRIRYKWVAFLHGIYRETLDAIQKNK